MLTIFGRKKITAERAAQIFSHHIVEVTEAGFPDVAGFINDSPEFGRGLSMTLLSLFKIRMFGRMILENS